MSALALLVAALQSAAAAPQEPQEPEAAARWSIDDLVAAEYVETLELSPDGTRAVYVKVTPDAASDRDRASLWLADLTTVTTRPLTAGDQEEAAPTWNADGSRIAFLAGPPRGSKEAEEIDQVWVMRMDGGNARPVTQLPEGVTGARWAGAGTLIVSAREPLSHEEAARAEQQDDSVVVEDPDRFRDAAIRLFVVELADDGGGDPEARPSIRRLTRNDDQIESFTVAPDGRYVAAIHRQSPLYEIDLRRPPKTIVWEIASGRGRELFAGRKSGPRFLAWSAEGDRLFAIANEPTVDGEDVAGVLGLFEVERDDAPGAASGVFRERRVELGWERGLEEEELVPVSGGFLARLADGVAPKWALFTRRRDAAAERGPAYARTMLQGSDAAHLERLAARPGTPALLYRTSTASDPGGWCVADRDGAALVDEEPIELCAPPVAGRRLARREIVTFAGANGDPVEAILWHPLDPPGGKRPLLLLTHGGPWAEDTDSFLDDWGGAYHLWAERGCYVLAVNYHGSSGYGRAFAESIKGRFLELELQDLVKGIEAVAAREPVDLDRLGCLGWSNGAILSIALTALLDDVAPGFRHAFKVCVAGAGDANWTSDWGSGDFGVAFDEYYLGAPPWRAPDVYLRKSPLFHADRVTTPTLILFGEEDTTVPASQGWEWYRALQQVGKAPVRFVLFPGEGHDFERLSSRRRKLEEEVRFVDEHLLGRKPAAPSPLREGSRLWSALAAEEFPRVGDAFGEPLAGPRMNWPSKGKTLVLPEVVDADGLEIGRFEVTRAQWAAFRPQTEVAPGTENLPISGVTFDDAQAYVAWLGAQTGDRWRLPTEGELQSVLDLAAAAGAPGDPADSENTLERWAGYAPAPADAARLVELAAGKLAARVAGVSPLLLDVGSCAPTLIGPPEQRVALFDLGGNVAEWATAEGSGVALGGCALLAADPGDEFAEPPAAAIGLRVVRARKRP